MSKQVLILSVWLALMLVTGCKTIPIPIPTPVLAVRVTAEPTAPEEVVMAAMSGWGTEQVDENRVELMLHYWADEATSQRIGFPPQIPAELAGKEAIRAVYLSWLPNHARLDVTVDVVAGDTVTTTTRYWSDATRAMGVAPLTGTNVYVVHNGRVISETWTLSAESQLQYAEAFGAMAEQDTSPTRTSEGDFAALPTYSEVVATYPPDAEACGTDATVIGRDETSMEFAAGYQLAIINNRITYDCYGTKITLGIDTIWDDGITYPSGTLLTVDADLNWIAVSSWD